MGDFTDGPVVKTLPSNAGGTGLIPGQRAKTSHASQPKNIKQKPYCNKFNKDVKKKKILGICDNGGKGFHIPIFQMKKQ